METSERTAAPAAETAAPARSCRRVGTFTFGLVLVTTGLVMLSSMFFPRLDVTLVLKLSPLLLVSLGIEVLLAARGGGKVRYDWVGMLLCCILVCTALALFAMAWYLVYGGGFHGDLCF